MKAYLIEAGRVAKACNARVGESCNGLINLLMEWLFPVDIGLVRRIRASVLSRRSVTAVLVRLVSFNK